MSHRFKERGPFCPQCEEELQHIRDDAKGWVCPSCTAWYRWKWDQDQDDARDNEEGIEGDE